MVTTTTPFPSSYEDPWSHFTSTHLDLTTTQNAFEQGRHAYSTQNYAQAMDFYTQALDALHHNVESIILLHRAVVYEKLHKYQEAMDDCMQVEVNINNNNQRQQQVHQHCPDLYWMKACIFIRYSELFEAACTYKKGSDTLSIQTFLDQKKQLHNQYDRVMKEIEYQNHWLMRRLPYEIVSNILSFMSWETQGQLALTCWFWYKFILQAWPGLGSHIDATIGHRSRLLCQFVQRLPPHHAKTLKLELCDMDDFSFFRFHDINLPQITWHESDSNSNSNIVFKNLIEHGWNKIETLNIRPFNNQQLQDILLLSKDSIKKLELNHHSRNHNFHHNEGLVDAVRTCNYIHTIAVHLNGPIDTQQIMSSLVSSDLSLTDISYTYIIPPSLLNQILIKTPTLTSLSVLNARGNYTEILKVIYSDAPQLQHLVLSHTTAVNDDVLSTTYNAQPLNSLTTRTAGLKSLSLTFLPEIEIDSNIDHVLGLFMERWYHSLETLNIKNGDVLTFQTLFTLLSKSSASNIQKLVLLLQDTDEEDTASNGPQLFSKLLLTCSHLNDIQLNWRYLYKDGGVYQALGSLPQLGKLRIDIQRAFDLNSDSENGQSIGSIARDDNLQTITSSTMSSMGASTFFEKTKSLWSLEISMKHSCDMDSRIVDLITSIGTCGSLRTLDVTNVNFKDNLLVLFMGSMKDSNIHTLKIGVSNQFLYAKELKALASLPLLEYLEITDESDNRIEAFDKPRLFRLFQEHQWNDRRFVVHIKSWVTLKGWKRPSDPSSMSAASLMNQDDKVECLHKLYSIQEPNNNFDFDSDSSDSDSNSDDDYYYRGYPAREIQYKKTYCDECGCHHGQQTGYDVNGVY
ncbi:hypothetical protein BDA99DRAFT_575248 [Phascolomyces articulosus]|uniref:F-box domain-containing protein n=1 Tax=Phascolomyces articulosus TaxID=60185 RepID=A0AAD5JRS8_9FUNG|nr:hypothetical protein BDA99DRAFT_575248 [Phascolomyces articulosus]